MRSNESQVQNAFDIVSSHDKRKVALLGLSFKAGTDDLRESPLVELAEMLIGKGFDLKIYDRSEEHTSELQSLMRISYAVFCLKKKKQRHILQKIKQSYTQITHTIHQQ